MRLVWFRQSLTQHRKDYVDVGIGRERASRRRGGGRNGNRHERAAAEKAALVDKTDR